MSKTIIPLESVPEFATALGLLVGHWAVVEMNLETLFCYQIEQDQFQARLIYQNFVSQSAKIDMSKRLLRRWRADKNLKEQIAKALNEASELNILRNTYIHSIWAAGDPGELTMVRQMLPRYSSKKPEFLPSRQVKIGEIQSVVERMSKLSAEIQHLTLIHIGAHK